MIAAIGFVATLLSLIYNAVLFSVMAAVVVAAVVRLKKTFTFLHAGVLVSAAVLVLRLPLQIAVIAVTSPTEVLQTLLGSAVEIPPVGSAMFGFLYISALVAILVVSVLVGLLYRILLVPTAIRADEHSYRLLTGRGRRFQGWSSAAALGVSAGVISLAVFIALGLYESQMTELLLELFHGLDLTSVGVQLGLVLPSLIGVAITEELLFRGVLQGWLTRWFGGTMRAATFAIVLTSAFWAFGHGAASEHFWPKAIQIFVIGLAFGAIARRYSVETSIVAHVALNVTAIVVGVTLQVAGVQL